MASSETKEDLLHRWKRFEAAKNRAMETLSFADGLAAREAFRASNGESTFSECGPQATMIKIPDPQQLGGNVVSFAEAKTTLLRQRWEIFAVALRRAQESRSPIDSTIAGTALYEFLMRPANRGNIGGNVVSFPDRGSIT